MMAVLDEVGSTDLEDIYCRRVSVGKGCPQVLQSAARQPTPRLEVTVHVFAALHRPDDQVERDFVDAEVRLPRDPEPPGRLSKGQQAHGI